MKILIDINHPAHVHYFRNFIKIMESKGHSFRVVNRNSVMINQLLDYYGIKHTIRNSRPKRKSALFSLFNLGMMIMADIKSSLSFSPDIYVGFASSSCAITATLFRKPCVLLDDTEHNTMNHNIYLKFCSCVLTPFYFKKEFGEKQLRFNSYVEQLYLHSSVYDSSCIDQLKTDSRGYILVRYISYDAHHDLLVCPIDEQAKYRIVKELSKEYQVYVSHEDNNPLYSQFRLNISPEQIHDVEANAQFLITEGATMASEAYVLGTPYIYINPLDVGNVNIQVANYPQMATKATDEQEILQAIRRICDTSCSNLRSELREQIERHTINPTSFFVWFIENYPESKTIIKENPDYQYKFK